MTTCRPLARKIQFGKSILTSTILYSRSRTSRIFFGFVRLKITRRRNSFSKRIRRDRSNRVLRCSYAAYLRNGIFKLLHRRWEKRVNFNGANMEKQKNKMFDLSCINFKIINSFFFIRYVFVPYLSDYSLYLRLFIMELLPTYDIVISILRLLIKSQEFLLE